MQMDARPNFLFLMTDQHRADHLGCYGNAVVRTPHIDSIAARGVTFDKFYVANPICMPNRATYMTGRMPSVHGVRHNGLPLSLDAVVFTDILRAAGYRTALIGKSHLQNMEDMAPMLTAEVRPDRARIDALSEARHSRIDGPEYEQEVGDRWRDPQHQLRLPYYGFDHVELCNLHGDTCFGDYSRWLEAQHPGADRLRGPENALADPRYSAPQAWRTRLPEDLYPTHYIAERTVAWLEAHALQGTEAPFFMQVSFPDPHHPWTPPGRYWDMYDPTAMPLPPTARWSESAPPHIQWLHAQRAAGTARLTTPALFAVYEREIREILALTYGMISMIDDRIGMILMALERCGLTHNTVVIFTSDHGDFMGDHGIMLKGPIHLQGLIRVPCIWAEPEQHTARRTSVLSGTLDIAPTILHRAGLASFNGMQGRSLLETITGRANTGPDARVIEEDGQRTYLGFTRPVRLRTLVTPHWRFSLYRGVTWGELYDLETDPYEMRNLWDDPGRRTIRAELTERLAHEMMDLCECSPLPTRIA